MKKTSCKSMNYCSFKSSHSMALWKIDVLEFSEKMHSDSPFFYWQVPVFMINFLFPLKEKNSCFSIASR